MELREKIKEILIRHYHFVDCDDVAEELLNLHIVSHSYYQVVFDGSNDDMQEVTAGLKTLEEAKQALEDNKKHFDEPMYIVAKINCG